MKIKCVIAILLYLAVSATASAKPRDVILTTDCGTEIDDQWAIVYLFLNPELHVKGIVSTHAPNIPNSEFSADCVRDVLHRLQVASPPPVFAGSNVPLRTRTPLRNPGVDFIVSTSRQYSPEHRLLILTIGATTDVGSAFLEDPTLPERIEILTMGFNSWPQGTDPWNIKNDPLAYKVILESAVPITIGSADVCRAHLKLSTKAVQEMFGQRGAIGKWMVELFQNWITKNPEVVAREVGPQQWVIWDVVVVADMLGYARFKTYPRPELNTADLTFSFANTDKTVNWITEINEKSMWTDFLKKIDLHNEVLSKSHLSQFSEGGSGLKPSISNTF
jgi:inosine-uridine nucleoside N-ribohydrolase